MAANNTITDPRQGPKVIRFFPDSVRDPVAREALQATWDDWAQGRFVADIPILYRPVQFHERLISAYPPTLPFSPGEHVLLVTDPTFQDTAASRSSQVGEITDVLAI